MLNWLYFLDKVDLFIHIYKLIYTHMCVCVGIWIYKISWFTQQGYLQSQTKFIYNLSPTKHMLLIYSLKVTFIMTQ